MRASHTAAAAVTLLTLSAPALAGTWTVPGTVNAGGLNNTRFVSDLAITNPGSAAVTATISFLPANATTPQVVPLNPGQTIVYRNVLDRLWGAQGAGATQVWSDAPLLIRARTYNTAASGTYGVALPVFAEDRILKAGKGADSLWVSQSADGNSGYRTNVAVVFPDSAGGAATVTIYGADGSELGSQDFSLDAAGFQQFGVGGFAGSVSVARASVEVTRGRAAGYSVVVDNVTGDSSLFTFEELPTGYQDVVVNGVARANGRNDTFFRTDGRFFNPTDEDAVVKVFFHASGPSNPAPVSGSLTVGAGRILDVTDLLGTLLQLPVGSAGALRFEADAPVAILCRTSNVDPLGVKPGTFGAQQKPTPLMSFLMSADAGAVVTGLRQNATFRTNVGFAAGADGAAYALTLKSAAGAVVATATGSLGALGWTQPSVQDLFPTISIPDDATLQVKVTAGSVDVFDSSIDNASGDPVVTPIMPLPADVPASASIGPQGGSVRSADGRLTLKVPAGALGNAVAVGLTAEVTGEADAIGPAYTLTPSSLVFAKPALLVFRPASGAPLDAGLVSVSLAVRSASGTYVATGGRIDASAGTLTVPISSTSASVGAARTAARLAAEPELQYLALTNVAFDPPFPFVLTDGTVSVGLVLRAPPSAAGTEARYVLRALDRNATIRWSRPRLGSIVAEANGSGTYTAPHRIRAGMWPVRLAVTIDGWGTRVVMRTSAGVLRRKWKIETQVTFDEPCGVPLPLGPYSLKWIGDADGTFVIDDDYRITQFFAALPEPVAPAWNLCPAPFYGWAAITPTGPFEIALKFDVSTTGLHLSHFDVNKGTFDLVGRSDVKKGGATLTGPQVTPLVVAGGDHTVPFEFRPRPIQEGEWVDLSGLLTTVKDRYRVISIDVP
ncbi:MAG: hypothetical protein ABI768_07700 [Acidobacteriota bacterium]